MNDQTDTQLLRAYAEHRSDSAFAELVRRHVDMVHSAAKRMVCDAHVAQDETQGVFLALASNAAQLTDRPVLSGWLHRTAQNIAAQTVRADVRRRVREQEAATMNELLSAEPDALWEQIAPHLDTALGELSEPDRDAVLLRYFERKSASEMAQTLGISDDAAQKRVNRAVERLREFFAKRGLTVGASGLVVVISANAVQAAPVGLAVTISTAVALAGSAVSTSTVIAATKAIAMTTLQKTLITATLAVVAGVGTYEARQASQLREQVQTLNQERAPLAEKVQQLQKERDEATNSNALLSEELAMMQKNTAELLKLRGQAGVLRAENKKLAEEKSTFQTEVSAKMRPGFGKLGDYISGEIVADLGNGTAEDLLQTFLWALREKRTDRLVQLGSPLLDDSGLSDSAKVILKLTKDALEATVGYKFSSKDADAPGSFEVKIEPVGDNADGFNISVLLLQDANGWRFGTHF